MNPHITKTTLFYQETAIQNSFTPGSNSNDFRDSGDSYDVIKKARELYFNRDRFLPF